DQVGATVTVLSNGNYVVTSPAWDGNRGAATWGSGSTGVQGTVSEANSLVGRDPGDQVGFGVTALSNGNYLARSPFWNANRGALTWASGGTGSRGAVSEANSLVGPAPGDFLGSLNPSGGSGLTLLGGGNYVVRSPLWDGGRGAVTWADGGTG